MMTMILYECRTCNGYKDSALDPGDFSDLGIKPCSCCDLAHDPRIFGTSKVGNEPVPTPADPYAHLKKAWAEGKNIRLSGMPWSNVKFGKDWFGWCDPVEHYEIEPDPVELTPCNKPPLGLTPSHVIQSRRISEIMRAIIRYEDEEELAPVEWMDELRGLLEKTEANK
jgi:hypothetical protein